MNKKEMIPRIKNFLKESYINLINGFEGCHFLELDEGLFVVAANVEVDKDDYKPTCKIAYNCDDLQSDYEYDWSMPEYEDGEVAFIEFELNFEKDDIKLDAEYLYNEAKAVIKEMKSGAIKDWR